MVRGQIKGAGVPIYWILALCDVVQCQYLPTVHVLVSRFVSATWQILVSRNASVHEQQYMFIIVAMV